VNKANAQKAPPPQWIAATLREGFDHLNAGRPEQASECCRRLLSAKPDLVQAHFLVGLVALELKQEHWAIQAFGSVTKLQPDHGAAWANLARLLTRAGHSGRADTALKKAVAHADGNPTVLDIIGMVHGLLGEQAEASHWYAQALAKQPDHIPFLINQANNLMFLDRLDEADSLLERVFSRAPGHPHAHWIKSGLRKAKDRGHLETLETLAAKQRQHPRALAFLYYAMGKELEDLEEWDAAFDAFDRGARARRETIDFDEQTEMAMFDAFASDLYPGVAGRRRISESRMHRRSSLSDNRAPAPRWSSVSSSRIRRCTPPASSNSSATACGVSATIVRPQANSPKLAAIVLARSIRTQLGRAYLQTTQKLRGDTPRFVDKLPPNYLYLPLILKALPNAKIVHLRRDPMDACFASYKQLFADAYPHSYDQREMARHHARYFKLMETWRERFRRPLLRYLLRGDTAAKLEPNARSADRFPGIALGGCLPELPQAGYGRDHRERGTGPPAGAHALRRALAPLRGAAGADAGGTRKGRRTRGALSNRATLAQRRREEVRPVWASRSCDPSVQSRPRSCREFPIPRHRDGRQNRRDRLPRWASGDPRNRPPDAAKTTGPG
jgi:tetratricopeptide (TPR) repeat protein